MIFHLRQVSSGWEAWRNNNTKIWEFGKTKEEAIYKLLITLGLIYLA